MRWVRSVAIDVVGVTAVTATLLVALRSDDVEAKGQGKAKAQDKAACAARAAGDQPPTYAHVEPIFAGKCASCHDSRKSDNAKPQAVFEMSSYPFATKRPGTLLADLKRMFETRGNLTADEKCLGIAWLAGGARDAEGNPPRWRE